MPSRLGVQDPHNPATAFQVEQAAREMVNGEFATATAYEVIVGLANVMMALIDSNPDPQDKLALGMSLIIAIGHTATGASIVSIAEPDVPTSGRKH